jgi:hypothetical protein
MNRRKRVDRSGTAPHRRSTTIPVESPPSMSTDGLKAIEIALEMAVLEGERQTLHDAWSKNLSAEQLTRLGDIARLMKTKSKQFQTHYKRFKAGK